ncbi:MAG TPA: hypothetical protein VF137_03040 [Candidatus Dormibacteraeota bacterium]
MFGRAALAIAAAVCAACAGTVGTSPLPRHSPRAATADLPSPKACPAPSITPGAAPTAVPEVQATAAQVIARIPIEAAPGGLHAAFGSIWTVNHRSNTISRIDPSTNRVAATLQVQIPDQQAGVGDVFAGSRYIWIGVAASPNQVWRLDPTTNTFDRKFTTDSVDAVAELNGELWVSVDANEGPARRNALEQLDPDTGAVVRKIDLGSPLSGQTYQPELGLGEGSLWTPVSNAEVARIDPVSGAITTIAVPSRPAGYGEWAFYAGHVFMTAYDFELLRIDPATNCVDGIAYFGSSLPRQPDPTAGPVGLIPAPQTLYAEFDRGALAAVDPATLQIVRAERIDVQDYIARSTYGFGSIWYTTFGNDAVLRLKPD